MKIIHYVAHEGGFIYEWHQFHMIAELRAAGHEVISLNPAAVLGRLGKPAEYSQILLDQIKTLHAEKEIDVFFATALDSTILPSAIDDISCLGICTINLSCDDLSHPYRVKSVCSRFDINWTTVRENKQLLTKYGAKTIVMPWGSNPNVFKPVSAKEKPFIGFIGAPYGARAQHTAEIALAGLPVKIYGRSPAELYSSTKINHPLVRALSGVGGSWERIVKSIFFKTGRTCLLGSLKRSVLETISTPPEKKIPNDIIEYIPSPKFEDMGKCFNTMALSLGSIELSSTYVLKSPLLFIRLREFEVPMCGGVHLVNRFPELLEYFEEDKEMLFYDDKEEMLDKIKFYLHPKQDKARHSIRQKARQRSVADHTWINRFQKIGTTLGLNF